MVTTPKKPIAYQTIATGIATLATLLSGSIAPARAANPYDQCAAQLSQAGIAADEAAKSCAAMLYPQELGQCVQQVAGKGIDASAALNACGQVRRPVEMASCFNRIQAKDSSVNSMDALGFCQRSLLPDRYGECVVGFNQSPLKVSMPDSLTSCISAGQQPKNLLPNFIPADQLPTIRNRNPEIGVPSTPAPTPSTPPSGGSSIPMPQPSPKP
jgi:hypothetical protein